MHWREKAMFLYLSPYLRVVDEEALLLWKSSCILSWLFGCCRVHEDNSANETSFSVTLNILKRLLASQHNFLKLATNVMKIYIE